LGWECIVGFICKLGWGCLQAGLLAVANFGGPRVTRGGISDPPPHPHSVGSPNPQTRGAKIDPRPPPSGLKPAGFGSKPARLPSLVEVEIPNASKPPSSLRAGRPPVQQRLPGR
jgi:hypothetical protein